MKLYFNLPNRAFIVTDGETNRAGLAMGYLLISFQGLSMENATDAILDAMEENPKKKRYYKQILDSLVKCDDWEVFDELWVRKTLDGEHN